MSSILSVTDASKRFGNTQALAGATMDLRPGEFLGLLGPNGAGKTTMIRAIAGRVRLDAGKIRLCDCDVTENGPAAKSARRRLGIVPQEIALYGQFTSRENLEFFGELNGLSGRELSDRIRWALNFTGLAERASDLVKGFSGGMKRRLNIACGILHRPDVVLLDEPTVGVDPQSRERIWEMLKELRAQGTALLLTSHQLDEVQLVCERIIIIDHGKTIANGTFDELVQKTIGPARRVTLALREAVKGLDGLNVGANGGRARVTRRVGNIAAELPALLSQVREAGGEIDDIHIESPSLQAVFLHLTGRELRE